METTDLKRKSNPIVFEIENTTDEIQENRVIFDMMDLFSDIKRETRMKYACVCYKEALADLHGKFARIGQIYINIIGEENFWKILTATSKNASASQVTTPIMVEVKEIQETKCAAETTCDFIIHNVFNLTINKVLPHTTMGIYLFPTEIYAPRLY